MRSIGDYVDMGLDVATAADHGAGIHVLGALAMGLAAAGLVEVVREGAGFAVRTWETPQDAVRLCTYPSTDREMNEALGRLSVEELERLEGALNAQRSQLMVQADESYDEGTRLLEEYESVKRRREEIGQLASEVSLAIDMHTPVQLAAPPPPPPVWLPTLRCAEAQGPTRPRMTPIAMFGGGQRRWAA